MTENATQDKHPGGRPTKYNPEVHIPVAKSMAWLGATNEQIAEKLEINLSTFYDWFKKHPEFSNPIKEAKEEADGRVVESLYKRATGYKQVEKHYEASEEGQTILSREIEKELPPDATSMIFWLKNRRPKDWRDKVDHGIGGPNGGPIQTQNVDDKELAKKIVHLLLKGEHNAKTEEET